MTLARAAYLRVFAAYSGIGVFTAPDSRSFLQVLTEPDLSQDPLLPPHCPRTVDTLEHWRSVVRATSRAKTTEMKVWSTSQRPGRGHHPLSEGLPITLNLDPQVALRLRGVTGEPGGRPAGPMSVPPQSPALRIYFPLPSLTSPAMFLPPAWPRAATSSLGAAHNCDDRDRLS